ncbi:MAG: GldG family protein [Candidatus Omnitrophota bacterium]
MKNRNSAILFGSGVLAAVWGAASIYIEQHLGFWAAGFCLWGVVVITFCLVRQSRTSGRGLTLLRWKKAGVIFLFIVFSLIVFAGINYLAARSSYRWDVTQSKQHTLTSNTIELIKGLGQEVQFSALYVGIPPTYLQDLFNEYARVSSGRIKFEIIDPVEKIGYAAQFGNVINSKENKVVVRSGKERRDVDFTQEPLSEEQLTNAIVRVTRNERHACFLTGHGEYSLTDKGESGLTTLAKSLEANNISSREVMLGMEDQVPQDCDVLVVAGPHDALTVKEEAAIGEYLKKGGDALFLIENVVVTTPDHPLSQDQVHKNPSLNSILNQWGVNVEEDVVVDLVNHAGSDVGSPATRNYAAHKAITEGLDYTFYVRPRSITVLKYRRPSIKLAYIVMTAPGEKSWAETDRTLKVAFDPRLDTMGPVPLAFVIYEEKKAEMLSGTRIIVFTDADFLTNIYIDQYSNARMGLNVINWLLESEDKVMVDRKEIKVERLDLTSKQRRQVAVLLFLMPLVIVAGGLIVWMRR